MKKLVTFFSDAMDKTQKKRIIDISRETTLKMVEDIIAQLDFISTNIPTAVIFAMPWDYLIKEFDPEKRQRKFSPTSYGINYCTFFVLGLIGENLFYYKRHCYICQSTFPQQNH